MHVGVERLLYWLWPPYEAAVADEIMSPRKDKSDDEARWEAILEEVRAALPADTGPEQLLEIAKEVEESEDRRKDILESKASSFSLSIGIALTILTAASALFADKKVPAAIVAILALTYLLGFVFLIVAACYAVMARSTAALASSLSSADDFLDAMHKDTWKGPERVVLTIAAAKWNETLLRRKSNYLSVAEVLFLRALILVAVAATTYVLSKILLLGAA